MVRHANPQGSNPNHSKGLKMAKAIPRVECTRCSRKGRYSVRKLIAQYGPAVIVQSASA